MVFGLHVDSNCLIDVLMQTRTVRALIYSMVDREALILIRLRNSWLHNRSQGKLGLFLIIVPFFQRKCKGNQREILPAVSKAKVTVNGCFQSAQVCGQYGFSPPSHPTPSIQNKKS